MAKVRTVLMTAIVLVVAVAGSGSVFFLVVLAWSALASALGPLLVVRAFRWPVDTNTALGMILAGLGCMLGWRHGLGLSDSIYEVLLGMAGDLFSTY